MDTRLIWTPGNCGQFRLSRRGKARTFSLKLTRLIRTPVNTDTLSCHFGARINRFWGVPEPKSQHRVQPRGLLPGHRWIGTGNGTYRFCQFPRFFLTVNKMTGTKWTNTNKIVLWDQSRSLNNVLFSDRAPGQGTGAWYK